MVKESLYRRHKRFNVEQDASFTSGDRYLIGNPPSCDPEVEAWHPKNRLYKHPPETFKFIYLSTAVSQEDLKDLIVHWHEKVDPFTQGDLLINNENQAQELIFRFRTSLFIPYHESLANNLSTLFNDAKEEDPVSLGIEAVSLLNFYNFLYLHKNLNLKRPAISLTPDDNIYASWRGNQNRVFSVHFLPSRDDVRFVIFKPHDLRPKKQVRFSGTVTIDTLIETVTPHGVLDWITK